MAAIAVTRFGLGARAGEFAEAGRDPMGWLLAQVRPAAAPDWLGQPHSAEILRDKRTFEAAEADNTARRDERIRITDAEALVRARHSVTTPAPFRERWARFWLNHFAVQGADFHTEILTGAFLREAIEPHMFGRFEDLLIAVSQHPAMLASLDQPQSVGPNSPHGREHGLGLNENLGRELLELHTLGVGGGYSQTDVTELAKALTGWRIGGENAPLSVRDRFFNDARWREPGVRRLLGATWPESDDRAEAMVRSLAHHPSTAERVASKLARHFVADAPPGGLVERLRATFARSGGDLRLTAEALITAPEAWSREQRKFKTPYEFYISALRAMDAPPTEGRIVTGTLYGMGHGPLTSRTPEGWSDEAASWATPLAIQQRADFAWANAKDAPHEDSRAFAKAALGPLMTRERMATIWRVGHDRPGAFALVLMTPEFQRR